jgi:precorrin-6A/cobalt-precorrin-6A reductase
MMRVLILGGTGDAAELAAKVATIQGLEAIISTVGRFAGWRLRWRGWIG